MPKIQKNKIEQCTKIFIYRDLKEIVDVCMQAKNTALESENNRIERTRLVSRPLGTN